MSIPRSSVKTIGLIAAVSMAAAAVMLGALLATVRPSPPGAIVEDGLRVRDADLLGVFEGRVPCEDCEAVKLRLVLYHDPATGSPTSFSLYRVHVGRSDDRLVTHGSWQIERTADSPGRVVYLLTGAADAYSRYLAVGNDILLILDAAMKPSVGDAAHSFTLSRTR